MPANSSEFEIKLRFPFGRLESIEKWIIARGGLRRQHLQSAYIDTPDFLLTQAGFAFRLRKEGRQWIQTLKVSTDNPLKRLEHNVVLDVAGDAMPNWCLDLHDQHNPGRLLKKRLPKLKTDDLQIRYQTDIWRRKTAVKTRQGMLEYALDLGSIHSLLSNGMASIPIQELEIELKEGDPQDVLHHALNLIKIHGAYIDSRSKSERGFLLASGLEFGLPARANFIPLKKAGDCHEMIGRLIHSCLQQILANQSVLNAEFKNYSEYLHQLRVGLCRLKVLFKYLARYDIFMSEQGVGVFKSTFSMLGEYRDNDYIENVLNPRLFSLGSSEIKLSNIAELPDPSHITRGKEFQLLLVELMSIGLTQASFIGGPTEDANVKDDAAILKKIVSQFLDDGFRFISNRAFKFSDLQDEEIHSMRKKMKFLRYSLEFFRDYCIKKTYPKFFKALTTTLDFFGLFNDICVAINRIEGLAQNDPTLLFALGWLKAERQRVRGLCGKSIKKLIQIKTPWQS